VKPLDYAIRCDEKPPEGREAAYAFAGWDPKVHMGRDGRPLPFWEAVNITRLVLPAPLPYLDGQTVTKVAVHKRVAVPLTAAFQAIEDAGLWSFLAPYGGGYVYRTVRGRQVVSMHGLGFGLDFDPDGNPLGSDPDESRFGSTGEGRAVVRFFELHGWYWGGRFRPRPDPMHFQFATGV
jgi:hypothetical protein